MVVQVCIGSTCHVKGSYIVVNRLQSMIERDNLEDRIEFKLIFCMGRCKQAVSVMLDGQDVYSVSPDTVEEFYEKQIKAPLLTASAADTVVLAADAAAPAAPGTDSAPGAGENQ